MFVADSKKTLKNINQLIQYLEILFLESKIFADKTVCKKLIFASCTNQTIVIDVKILKDRYLSFLSNFKYVLIIRKEKK